MGLSDYERVMAERFPDYREVRREALAPIPPPTLTHRHGRPVTVDTMAAEAAARVEYEDRMREYRKHREAYARREAESA